MEDKLLAVGKAALEECKRWPWNHEEVTVLAKMLASMAEQLETRLVNQLTLPGVK